MAQSILQIKSRLLREYYKDFSKYAKGKLPEKKVAWVTAFVPVEILEALDISYYYPESYAAVIAASSAEQPLLEESEAGCLSRDCCSYSCCIEGCMEQEKGPRAARPGCADRNEQSVQYAADLVEHSGRAVSGAADRAGLSGRDGGPPACV